MSLVKISRQRDEVSGEESALCFQNAVFIQNCCIGSHQSVCIGQQAGGETAGYSGVCAHKTPILSNQEPTHDLI